MGDPYTIDGGKVTLRVYVLLTGLGELFVYERFVVIRSPLPFDARSEDRRVHISQEGGQRIDSDQLPMLQDAFPDICKILANAVGAVSRNLNLLRDESRYHVIGADFVLTRNLEPFLIELNDWPTLKYHKTEERNVCIVVRQMLRDFLRLLLDDDSVGRFVKVTEY